MTVTPVAKGASLPLWQPDEEILAVNLNARERTYGGFYLEDNFGMSTGVPVFSSSIAGALYGEGSLYGFMTYQAIAGAGLIEDSIDVEDDPPTFTTGTPYFAYGAGDYGFMSYGSNPLTDGISLSDLSPTVTDAPAGGLYGSGLEFGYLQYGGVPDVTDIVIFDDSASITLTVSNSSVNVYGQGKLYGFSEYVGS